MLTIKAEVQKDRKRMDGSYNVKIRFTKGRAVKRISTDLFATGEDTDRKRNIHSTTNQERFQSINRDRGTSLYLFFIIVCMLLCKN